jgi:hypothetical protein
LGIDQGPLTPETRAAARRIAASLDARRGSLRALLICPPGPPPVEEFRDFGCRLVGNTRIVLQVDEPESTAEGLVVWVGKWSQVTNSKGTSRVYPLAREVKLRRGPAGDWIVTGIGRTIAAH